MRIVFMGSPDFAVPTLKSLFREFEVVAVFTQPPKPKGRGKKLVKTAIHEVAETHNLPVFTPKTLRKGAGLEALQELAPDVIVVAAYGLILPKAVLNIPTKGCLNVHGSLLPRWRGAAPIHYAMLEGDGQTGITIMQMDEGMDTGDMLLKGALPITPATTFQELHDQMAQMGANLMVEVLKNLDTIKAEPQDEAKATYAPKLTKEQGRIDWSTTAERVERQVRALAVWPGAWTMWKDQPLKILEVEIEEYFGQVQPGEVIDAHLAVACGGNAIRIKHLQKAGKKAQSATEFLRGTSIQSGERFV